MTGLQKDAVALSSAASQHNTVTVRHPVYNVPARQSVKIPSFAELLFLYGSPFHLKMNKTDCKQLILQNMDYIVTDLQPRMPLVVW